MPFAACPVCGSRHLRDSAPQSAREWLRSVTGIVPLRCRSCGTRFSSPLWNFAGWQYARCPKCFRMDLAPWSEEYRKPPKRMILQMRLGAKPYRCEICRVNFVSFRALKEAYAGRSVKPREKAENKNGSK